jgi:hypothetical protein
MKKFVIFLTFILLAIILCFKLFFDPIAKSFIEKNLSKDTGRIVVIQSVETDLFKGVFQVRNLQLKNDKIFSRENLITIPLLEINFNINKLLSNEIRFTKIVVHNSIINYDVIIKDGKLFDSFYLVEQVLKKENKNQINSNNNQINSNNNKKKEDNSKSINKSPRIDFIIDRLIIPKVTISAYAKDLQFEKNINIGQMNFDNVGNTKESNHYKDVMAMIVANMAIQINNEVIKSNLRKQFEKKLKELLKKDNIKSIIGNDPNKILNKLEKLFK